jgi:GGDEF domain-containing protein
LLSQPHLADGRHKERVVERGFPMERFLVERGDVLLSVQMILTREEEFRRRQLGPSNAAATASASQSVPPARPAVATVRAPTSPRVATPQRYPQAPQPARPPSMVDPLTGVGTIHALRRDLMLEQTWPVAGRTSPTLVALEIAPLDQIREAMGAPAADRVLKSLVELVPFALRTQDRVYRSGRNQLTVLLSGGDGAGAEGARSALETALQRNLAGKGYPELRLTARKLDPVALAS